MSDRQYSYPRYLTAKKPVDARALNRRVWGIFLDQLAGSSQLRILEVGGGVGATLERIVRALEERPPELLDYTFVDVTPENIDEARSSLRDFAQNRGYEVRGETEQRWRGGPLNVTVDFRTMDLFDLSSTLSTASYDSIVGQAVLDLVPLSSALSALGSLLRDGGLWYLPLHFDGVTAFEPVLDPDLDDRIERRYHHSMSEGERHGARSGRRLLTQLPDHGARLLAAGSSDWVVFPEEGGYRGDEAYFLHHILHFIESELSGDPKMQEDVFSSWIDTRRRQVEEGTLIYVAHQLDVVAEHGAHES